LKSLEKWGKFKLYNTHIKRQADPSQGGLFFAMGGVGIIQKEIVYK
jgi:hypothetical protein